MPLGAPGGSFPSKRVEIVPCWLLKAFRIDATSSSVCVLPLLPPIPDAINQTTTPTMIAGTRIAATEQERASRRRAGVPTSHRRRRRYSRIHAEMSGRRGDASLPSPAGGVSWSGTAELLREARGSGMGWTEGFEPSISRATTWRLNR